MRGGNKVNEENEQNMLSKSDPVPQPPGIRKFLHKGKKARRKHIKKNNKFF